MTPQQAIRIIDESGPIMAHFFGLDNWIITYKIHNDSPGMEVLTRANYREADISVNPIAFFTKNEILDTLRHEHIHILMADIDDMKSIVSCIIKEQNMIEAVDSVFFRSCERVTYCVERWLDRIGLRGEQIINQYKDADVSLCKERMRWKR